MQPGLVKALVRGESGELVEVRRFASRPLQDAVENAVAALGGDKAVLNLEQNPEGYNAAIAFRLDGRWSIALGYTRGDWGWAAGAQVRFSG